MKNFAVTCILALGMAVLTDVSHAQGSQLPIGSSTSWQGTLTASANVPVRATVIRPLLVTSTQAIDFGFVAAPASGTETFDELQAGQVTISGDPGATVSIVRATALVNSVVDLGNGVTYEPTPLTDNSVTLSGNGNGGSAATTTITITGKLHVSDTAGGNYDTTETIEFAYTSI